MTAVDTVKIGHADAAIALSATRGNLAGALRAEMKVGLSTRAAGRAAGDDGLAEQEIKHRADSAGHDEADCDPEAQTHSSARSVLADVADHEDVERSQSAPGKREVNAEADRRRRVIAVGWQDDPEEILGDEKCQDCQGDGPARDEAHLVGKGRTGVGISEGCRLFHRWTFAGQN